MGTSGTDDGGAASGREVVAELTRASRSFGKVRAVADLDFALRAGEVVALLGPNGAGKTTTVRLLMGLIRPSGGSARLFGMDPARLEARMKVGAMLQVSKVPETLRVREHVELFSSYYPHPLPLAEVLAAAGLEGLEGRLFGKLSGGQRQRVLFALALCGDPELLFLDEPSAGLDVESRRSLWERIAARKRGGGAVLLTTHNLEEADHLADRVVLLDRGRLLAEGTPEQIKARVAGRKVRCRTTLAAGELERLPGARTVRRDGEMVEIFAAEPERLVAALLAADPALTGLEVRGAGLEEAFLALTGGAGGDPAAPGGPGSKDEQEAA
ncbi:MAG TPA: ABC transporter ATP-binding protein [Thermoanaerobaculia bacterium]|jgi:ABC-2 type transport system ATP-binding protein|nr:ABC transporter ATP-binding protein [Thermoanaerobaculia bacterium]